MFDHLLEMIWFVALKKSFDIPGCRRNVTLEYLCIWIRSISISFLRSSMFHFLFCLLYFANIVQLTKQNYIKIFVLVAFLVLCIQIGTSLYHYSQIVHSLCMLMLSQNRRAYEACLVVLRSLSIHIDQVSNERALKIIFWISTKYSDDWLDSTRPDPIRG